jgi:hypothetical protein
MVALMIPNLPNELVHHILFYIDDPKIWLQLRGVSKTWEVYIDSHIFGQI